MVSVATPISRKVAAQQVTPGTGAPAVNVGETERVVSALGGGALALVGLSRGNAAGLTLAALGGALLYRGLTGHCPLYGTFGIDTVHDHNPATSVPAAQGVRVEAAVTIDRPAEELYRYWRDFERLPHIMSHLRTVTVHGDKSHWVAQAPLGMSVEWDAEVINDRPNELIAWRSLQGSAVSTAGSVHFNQAPGNRGTEIHVTLKFDPPGGKLGAALARLFGADPRQQIREDLRRFKQLMEAGELPTTAGQSTCRQS
jgi:uncharacterized membrane protein